MEDKVQAIQAVQRPRTELGLSGYYCRYIPHYATIALPLTNMTCKMQPNEALGTTEAEAFQELKRILSSDQVMSNPDPSQIFVLQTDAYDVGIGAVLSQGCEEHPITYYSRKLLDSERKYSVVEKECLAWC